MTEPNKENTLHEYFKNKQYFYVALAAAAIGFIFLLFAFSTQASLVIIVSLTALILIALACVFELFRLQNNEVTRTYTKIEKRIRSLEPDLAEKGRSLFDSMAAVLDKSSAVEYKYQKLIGIIEILQSNEPFQTILENMYYSFREFLPYTHIGVALIDRSGKTIRASFAASSEHHKLLIKNLLGYEAPISATSLGKVLSSGRPRVINDLQAYLSGRKPVGYNAILLEAGIRSSITYPLIKNGKPVGIIFFSSDRPNAYHQEHTDFLNLLANSLMLSLERDILVDEMVVSTTLALAMLTEERSQETGDHLTRMKNYSRLVAELLSEDERYSGKISLHFISEIERFSPLHDIGKVAMPDEILNKPGRLTKEEFEVMKKHTIYGATVLSRADAYIGSYGRSIFATGIEIVESHHEWWNGTGYPYALKGEQIPLSARIVAVADVFDALTSERVYKRAMSFDEAVGLMLGEAGTHFDPQIMDVFKKNIGRVKAMYGEFNSAT